jgi:hypothetical protein
VPFWFLAAQQSDRNAGIGCLLTTTSQMCRAKARPEQPVAAVARLETTQRRKSCFCFHLGKDPDLMIHLAAICKQCAFCDLRVGSQAQGGIVVVDDFIKTSEGFFALLS